ncbi:outer membrane beta-barrel protein [Treponema sp. R6D11]
MKKLFFVLIVFGIAGTSLFAWEPQDLTKFPPGQDAKSWILNFGVGFPDFYRFKKDYVYIPPIRLSLDRNIEIGDNKLPFFAGGIFGYSGYGWKGYVSHDFSLGGRFGYHFNWDVKNLDTYAVTTAGWIFYSGWRDSDYLGWPLWGVSLGARYFVNEWFGFWTETGYNTNYFNLDIGFAFKF